MQDGISSAAHDESWLELRLPAHAMEAEAFDRLCQALSAAGQALETRADTGTTERVAWFPAGDTDAMRARLTAALALAGVPAEAARLRLLDDDWATAWQRDWKAVAVGKRLWVRPSFCEPAPEGRLDIVLEPGMAFGTGGHATTRLCLEAIERIMDAEPVADVLDMGAGSGILAIAAAGLGARRVLAVDNDPDAVAACRANARANAVELTCRLADTPPAETFDLVVANILAGPLMGMAPALARCVRRSLLLSGILESQADAVAAAFTARGLRLVETTRMDGWVCLALQPRERIRASQGSTAAGTSEETSPPIEAISRMKREDTKV